MFPAAPLRFGEELSAIRVATTVVIVRNEVRRAQPTPSPTRQHHDAIVPGSD
jgi:hypothetical protein